MACSVLRSVPNVTFDGGHVGLVRSGRVDLERQGRWTAGKGFQTGSFYCWADRVSLALEQSTVVHRLVIVDICSRVSVIRIENYFIYCN